MGNVYYLYSNSSVGDNSAPMSLNSVWPLLNTGYLAHEQDGTVLIEAPWWNVMQPFARFQPDSMTLRLRDEFLASHPKPGICIGDRTYVVAGINVTDVSQVKQLWRVKDVATLETNRQVMIDDLLRMGFRFSDR